MPARGFEDGKWAAPMRRASRGAMVAVALVIAAAACSGGGPSAASSTTTAPSVPTQSTTGGTGGASSTTVQSSGDRTVLSPVGLNVRSGPSTTATVLGSAAEGTTLTVLGHTDQDGGWYQVKGATVSSGYIKDDPTLSAAGDFQSYADGASSFAALYPANWTSKMLQPDGVEFSAPTGQDSIVIDTAMKPSQLPQAQLGYHTTNSTSLVVCGVTGELNTYTQISGATQTATSLASGTVAEKYLVQIDLTLDPTHALGVDAFLADLSQEPVVDDVINSLSFPFPVCQGGATSPSSSPSPTVTPTT